MPTRPQGTRTDFMFPGKPNVGPVGKSLLKLLSRAADDIVVVRDSRWDEMARQAAPELAGKVRWMEGGDDFAGRITGLASTGRRVAGFAGREDARLFSRRFARRPFPTALVVHALGAVEPDSSAYGFALTAATPQESIDFTLIGHRIAEEVLTPGVCSHLSFEDAADIATVLEPEPGFVDELLQDPREIVTSATPAQQMLFGSERRRIPVLIDLNRPVGVRANAGSRTGVLAEAGYDAFFLDELPGAIDRVLDEFGSLTGRFHEPVSRLGAPDADLVILSEGPTEAIEVSRSAVNADSKHKLALLKISLPRPFPTDELVEKLAGCRVVTVLEPAEHRGRQLTEAVRSTLRLAAGRDRPMPAVYEAIVGPTGAISPGEALALWTNMLPGGRGLTRFHLGIDFAPEDIRVPSLERLYQSIRRSYTNIGNLGLPESAGDVRPGPTAITLLIAGLEERGAAVTEALAKTAFSLFNRPVASVSTLSEAGAGKVRDVVLSIGAVSPAVSRLYHADVVFATRPNSLSARLQKHVTNNASIYVPSSLVERLDPSTLRVLAERGAPVFKVDIDPDCPEPEKLATLILAWAESKDSRLDVSTDLAAGFREALAASPLKINREDNAPINIKRWSPPSDLHSLVDTEPPAPDAVRRAVARTENLADASRFWRTVGYAYASDRHEALSPDPYISSNTLPARTGSFRSGASRLNGVPGLLPENCTGCAACTAFCPEGAIRISVQPLERILDYAIEQVDARGTETTQLQRAAKPLVKQAHRLAVRDQLLQNRTVGDLLKEALDPVLEAMSPAKETRENLLAGFEGVLQVVGSIPVVKTDRFFALPEKEVRGTGELFLLGIDPDTCTECGLCISACPDDALETTEATADRIESTRSIVRAVTDLQPEVYMADDAISTDFLMGRKAAESVIGSDPTLVGSGTKLTVRLVCALIEAEMAARFEALATEASSLLDSIDEEIRHLLNRAIEVNDFEAFAGKLDELKSDRLTTADLADLVSDSSVEMIDAVKLGRLTRIRARLDTARTELLSGDSGDGRARMAAVFGSGRVLERSLTFPFNPYAFPWLRAADGAPLATAEGLFEGIMDSMCSTFETLREARRLAKGLDPVDEDTLLRRQDLTEEEWLACPPVCVFTQNEADVPRSWMQTEIPINLFILDRNRTLLEGGWGRRLWPLACPDWFLLHSTAASFEHFSSGIQAGVKCRRPSVFRLYAPEPGESDIRPDRLLELMKSAVSSRAFPLLRYDPDPDREWTDRWSLDGNESVDDDWIVPDEAEDAEKDAAAFWRLLQQLSGVRSTALSKAKREAESEIDRQVSELRTSIEAGAQAEIDRVKNDHEAIYREKLVAKLLALSGFGPGTEAHDRKLNELLS